MLNFLPNGEKKIFLMYSLFLAYGIAHAKQHTFLKRKTANIVTNFAQQAISGLASPHVLNAGSSLISKLGWSALGDTAGDKDRGWTYFSFLFAARVVGWVACQIAIEAALNPPITKIRELIQKATEPVSKEILLSKMDQWLKEKIVPGLLADNHILNCYQHRLYYIGFKLQEMFYAKENQKSVRQWLISKMNHSVKKMYAESKTEKSCNYKIDSDLNKYNHSGVLVLSKTDKE